MLRYDKTPLCFGMDDRLVAFFLTPDSLCADTECDARTGRHQLLFFSLTVALKSRCRA